jgi:hypothetical protein
LSTEVSLPDFLPTEVLSTDFLPTEVLSTYFLSTEVLFHRLKFCRPMTTWCWCWNQNLCRPKCSRWIMSRRHDATEKSINDEHQRMTFLCAAYFRTHPRRNVTQLKLPLGTFGL